MVNGTVEMQRRTGQRLRAARERLRLSRSEAARRAGLTRRELAAYEKGRWRVPPTTMARLAHTYGLPTGEVVPSRSASPLEIETERVAAGEVERRIPSDATPDEVLGEYLDLVRELRGLDEDDQLPLRDVDLAVLAEALGGSPQRIENRLVELISCTREEARAIRKALLRRRLVAPAAGFLLGVGGLSPAIASADGHAGEIPDLASATDDVAAEASVEEAPLAEDAPSTDEAADEAADEVADEVADEAPVLDAAPDPADEATGPSDEEHPDDDWAEIIPPLVIERD